MWTKKITMRTRQRDKRDGIIVLFAKGVELSCQLSSWAVTQWLLDNCFRDCFRCVILRAVHERKKNPLEVVPRWSKSVLSSRREICNEYPFLLSYPGMRDLHKIAQRISYNLVHVQLVFPLKVCWVQQDLTSRIWERSDINVNCIWSEYWNKMLHNLFE